MLARAEHAEETILQEAGVDSWLGVHMRRLDTVATLQTQGLTGIGYVELRGGRKDSPMLQAAPGQEVPVIASGGLGSIEDIKTLLSPRAKKLGGAVAGRALYDGRLDAAEALKLIRNARAAG